jgi:hypothetical protein
MSTVGAQWEHSGSTVGVQWEYSGSTVGVQVEYSGSACTVCWRAGRRRRGRGGQLPAGAFGDAVGGFKAKNKEMALSPFCFLSFFGSSDPPAPSQGPPE